MVMQVSSQSLQEQLDQFEHMFRYGLNVPHHFLVHDSISWDDLINEWCFEKDLTNIRLVRYSRTDLDAPEVMPSSVEMLREKFSKDSTEEFYYLAMPYIEPSEFVQCGWVLTPEPNKFEIEFGYRRDHRIPFEDDQESEFGPSKILRFDYRDSIPLADAFYGDLKRIACGFPYPKCRLVWSLTDEVYGRNNSSLCFWEYQVSEEYVRD